MVYRKFSGLTLLVALLILTSMHPVRFAVAQNPYLKQVLSGNSGKFEFAPPFQDYVSVQFNHPVTGNPSGTHTIFTQSVQDILIHGNKACIAAQDSLVKINTDTYQRTAAIADSGLSKLLLFGDKLIVTKQYPITTFYAEVLNADDLSLVASIPGIPGDCGGLTYAGDSIYIAVNGGWMGTEGKIAVVETTGWSVARIINLGPQAIGIMSIIHHDNKLITVNKSPFSNPGAGSISVYDLSNHTFTNILFDKNVSTAAGTDGHLLYFGYNYGIASFNMNTLEIENPAVVPDPGSSLFRYITSAATDSLNQRLFVNVGDYIGPGTCQVYSTAGDSLFSFSTGISTDAIAMDYRMAPLGVAPSVAPKQVTIHPNPAEDVITVNLPEKISAATFRIFDAVGKQCYTGTLEAGRKMVRIPVSTLGTGLYFLIIQDPEGELHAKFLKK